MDILKKCVVLVAILSISLFMVGCGGGEEEADGASESGGAPAGGPPSGGPRGPRGPGGPGGGAKPGPQG